ncbi:MAG: magnesium transporter [Candidatus Synechococcus spongiarum 142]|uniref:Magnesium transporter MgtE n=1 Tax=Candidatus Synechococcus spongiarum 142 TaxID=1608213 RepID=A0A6N3XD48_9SYNE|nr:MAG: magnesium transporter [Candidatus Synechococcus spongiarum 142]
MNSNRPSVSEQVAQQLAVLLQDGSYDRVKHLLEPLQPVDIAEAIGTLPTAQQALGFRLLPKDLAIEVYEDLEPLVQQALLETLRSNEVLEVVEQMAPDDRVRLFDELPAKVVRRLLQQLSPEERRVTAQLLGYAPGTAGRLMTTEFIALKQQQTVAEALNVVRRRARETETVYALYVTDGFSRLTGTLSLRELVTAEPELLVAEAMTREVVSLTTEVDQEEAARWIQRYDFLALPVVDRETRLVGIITVDDVIDVIEQEATEDLYAAGGIQTTDEDDYFQINLLQVARRRFVWLLVLLLANVGTASVIAAQDEVLSQYVSLAAFIPLLIGTGGNVGAQSSTVVIRGLSTRSIQAIGAWQSVLRESAAGALLGLLLSVIVSLVAWVLGYPQQVALAVVGSLLAIATMAATAGSLLPLLFRRLGFDPALMSAPFITTVVDVVGVFVYLQLASKLLLPMA